MQQKKSLTQRFFMSILLTSIILISFIGIYSIINEFDRFNIESKRTISEYIKTQKIIIKNETEKVIDYINYKRNSSNESLKKSIKERVYEAYGIAEYIYNKNQSTKTRNEIKELIIDALRPVRFNHGRSYYFIDNLEGNAIMSPVDPFSENKNYINLQDLKGKFVIREFIDIAKTKNEGYLSYYAPIPKTNTSISFEQYEKISYIKYFAPFNWIIATGDYLEGDKTDLQEELLKRISKIIFNENESIFVIDFEGKTLAPLDDTLAEISNLFNIPFNTIESDDIKNSFLNNKGFFVSNNWENTDQIDNPDKTYFTSIIPDWKWIVGAELNYEKINSHVQTEKKKLIKRVQKQIIEILIFLIITLTIALFFAKRFSKKIVKNVDVFISFFKEATKKSKKVDITNLHFQEFETLAESANSMIDEREIIKKALQLEEVHLKELFENSPEGIVLTNNENVILKINPAFTKIFGYNQNEVIGKPINNLIVADKYLHEAEELSNKFSEGNYIAKETLRKNKNGNLIDVSILGVPVYLKEERVALYAIYRDIRKQKKSEKEIIRAKEKAEEAHKLKTAFLTNMSHEIRTPMNAIIGFSDLLSKNNISGKEKNECIRFIKNSSNELLNLIDAIIDIAKIETGQLKIKKSECHVDQMLLKLYNNIKNKSLVKKDLKFRLNMDHNDENLTIYSDPLKLNQILFNLVKNAIKFTEKGSVEFGYTLNEKSFVEFYVKDTGIGITKKAQEIIFESFRQLDDSVTRKYEGTGIGLTIVKNLVELLGGEIWLESEPKKGSTFYFKIPFK